MRAADLAAPYPTVGLQDLIIDAARTLSQTRLAQLIVVDADRRPVTILGRSHVLQAAVPECCRDDPTRR